MKVIKQGNWYLLEVPNSNPIWLGKVVNGIFTFKRDWKKNQVFHTKDAGSISLNKELLENLRKDGITQTQYIYSNTDVNGVKIERTYLISVDEWFSCGANYHNPVFPYDNQKTLMKGVIIKNEKINLKDKQKSLNIIEFTKEEE